MMSSSLKKDVYLHDVFLHWNMLRRGSFAYNKQNKFDTITMWIVDHVIFLEIFLSLILTLMNYVLIPKKWCLQNIFCVFIASRTQLVPRPVYTPINLKQFAALMGCKTIYKDVLLQEEGEIKSTQGLVILKIVQKVSSILVCLLS